MIGIDEVGRGPLAGPLLVCAVRITQQPDKLLLNRITDSKKLSCKKRDELFDNIIRLCQYNFAWVSAESIDNNGISKSMNWACERAVAKLQPQPDEIIILDGNINYLPNYQVKTIIKADATVKSVSMASILAKVTRDDYMKNIHTKYPDYDFINNMGYGTPRHITALRQFGPCPEHRKSYLQKILNTN